MTSTPDIPNTRRLVIACIEDHPKMITLLRLARKRAQEKNIRWRAVFVETPAYMRQKDGDMHARMLRWLTLAEQMGGETEHLEAQTLEKGLKQFLEKESPNVSLFIIGGAEREGRFSLLRTWPRHHIISLLRQHTQVEVVPLENYQYSRKLIEKLHLRNVRPQHLVYALLVVGLAYLAAYGLQQYMPPALFRVNDQNLGLLFMIACAFAAGRFGLLPGLVASVASFLTINYYFTLPYHVLKINAITDVINMALFLFVAILISLFSSQNREVAQKAAKRETSTQALFTLYRVASESFTRHQALEKLQQKLEHMLEANVAFFIPTILRQDRIETAFPKGLVLEGNDRKALDVCWSDMKTTGAASPFNPGTLWRFEPMISPLGEIGVLGVKPLRRAQLDTWFGRLLTAIADQTATVMEHIDMERSMEETRVREEREQLRSMLLSSVTHDFKTPLAGIIGALSVHRSLGNRLTPQKQSELIEAAMEEAQRLDSFITNILDMTRLESGNIRFRKEWYDVKTMVWNVTKRLNHRLRQHQLVVQPYAGGIEVFMDVMMTEQVLQNVLDNACKYTPPGTRIEISCHVDEKQGFIWQVRDYGTGLPAEKLERVFDKYARLHKKDSQVAGTGLGLSISKAVIEAQGGWITAENHPEGGAVFTFCLPEWRKLEKLKEAQEGAA